MFWILGYFCNVFLFYEHFNFIVIILVHDNCCLPFSTTVITYNLTCNFLFHVYQYFHFLFNPRFSYISFHFFLCNLVSSKEWVHAWVSPCGICGGQRGTGEGFSLSSLTFLSLAFYCGTP
jgi:hypothetical protein